MVKETLKGIEREIVKNYLLKNNLKLARREDWVNGEFTTFMDTESYLSMTGFGETRVWTDGTWIP